MTVVLLEARGGGWAQGGPWPYSVLLIWFRALYPAREGGLVRSDTGGVVC